MEGTENAPQTLIVAIEDLATAGVVAAAAAHIARDLHAECLVLLHALDEHTVLSAMVSVAGYAAPLAETGEEGERVLDLAEAALRAEYAGIGAAVPLIEREITNDDPARAIEHASAVPGVIGVVLGARRPHAFGRLTHPDVCAHVTHHLTVPVYVAPLQAG